ncbi:Mst2 complex subunit nto1 [Erysiphe neolycopersici]|uniref:Mst2 complex subunit nto1 n=1 Tax=Erysiphe neolycopersici TaxID=212602 RepID=A0A420HW85_9PEZI|nr:Mst2 complex subunit nto1 [Erysiphe neolycopersici]
MSLPSDTSPLSNKPRSTRPRSSGTISDNSAKANNSSEPANKKRKYIPGGPGGGGRYIDEDGIEMLVGGIVTDGHNYVGSRGSGIRQNTTIDLAPEVFSPRDRTRNSLPRSQPSSMRFSSAAQAAAVVQNDGYKPREERAWEEFHPNLDIDLSLRAFSASEVEGQLEKGPSITLASPHSSKGQVISRIERPIQVDSKSGPLALGIIDISKLRIPGTPGGGKRRPGRPPKDPVAFFAAKAAAKLGKGFHYNPQKTPNNKPSTPNFKENLKLHKPSFRLSNTLSHFENNQERHVDKLMANVGYQESNLFCRPERTLIKVSDINLEEDLDFGLDYICGGGEGVTPIESGGIGRVEYDMDEHDDKWLDTYNIERKAAGIEMIQREIFEITITKIEKEWHNLEKRIPKSNPKPPQIYRPRSSSAAAVNGEAQAGEEQDSRCAICDDGDCENTNAIVFCDGCDLAVHQNCYGVPFIPEGQWLCRKCQLIGRGVPTCIFCPNTDGAFKQTSASKWAHLLCAIWIPEVSIGNTSFMEPVMDIEKVPKTRWKLTCYLCNQRMGACIQCGNKSCYQAFHVTCARRARLFLKMKNNQGTLSVLEGITNMKAFCDKHCPTDWAKENDVASATREARAYYKRTMRGRLWADSQACALKMAANNCYSNNEHQMNDSQLTGIKLESASDQSKTNGFQSQKSAWKLPSGAPVIPFCVYEKVEKSLARFNFQKCNEFTADVCRYWTLKREARRGAALLKRLQLQMEAFSSMEITRRNFPGMGPTGRPRLQRRIEFAKILMNDIENLKKLSENIVKREIMKLDVAKHEVDFVDIVYFPIVRFFLTILKKASALDTNNFFTKGFSELQRKLEFRQFTSVIPFARELSKILQCKTNVEIDVQPNDIKKTIKEDENFRMLAKRILVEAVQPTLNIAVQAESEISGKPVDELLKDLSNIFEIIPKTKSKPLEIRPTLMTNDNVTHGISESITETCNLSHESQIKSKEETP